MVIVIIIIILFIEDAQLDKSKVNPKVLNVPKYSIFTHQLQPRSVKQVQLFNLSKLLGHVKAKESPNFPC